MLVELAGLCRAISCPTCCVRATRRSTFVRPREQLGRAIATPCHGPEVLVSSGRATAHVVARVAADLLKVDAPLVRDGKLDDPAGEQAAALLVAPGRIV